MSEEKSFLDNIEIATPCSANWNEMDGDERMRRCGECKLNVYNLSQMTRKEAVHMIREKEDRLCMRVYRRKDGTVITSDCPTGLRAAWKHAVKMFAVVGALLLFIMGGFLFANRKSINLRRIQPFTAILNWINPQATVEMGEPCRVLPTPKPTPKKGP